MKNIILLLFLTLTVSCQRDYRTEMENKIKKYEEEGKEVITKSFDRHIIIYNDNSSIWIDNLVEAPKAFLTTGKEMQLSFYHLEWDNSGAPYIELFSEPYITAELDVKCWSEKSYDYKYKYDNQYYFDLCKNDSAVYFSCITEGYDRGGSPIEYTNDYIYYFAVPGQLFVLNDEFTTADVSDYNIYDKDLIDYAMSSASALADKIIDPTQMNNNMFEYVCNSNSGGFYWGFKTDAKGNIYYKENNITYRNSLIDKEIEINFNISDFSSKEKALEVLKTINDSIENIYIRRITEEIKNSAITLDELSDQFKNQIKSERELIGKQIILKCDFDAIKKADGWFDTKGYKYKLISSSTEIMDTWWSGYDVIAYTNDESFTELEYPKSVIMQCTVVSGSSRYFEFKECRLLMY